MNVDLRGVFLVTRFVLPGMLERGSGKIINVASQLGIKGGEELVHYSAAKAGVIGMTRALAREVSPTVNVNAIAPGPIETPLMDDITAEWKTAKAAELPMNRFGTVLVHGIAAMPGKPSLLGVSGNTILVGAPGYPVSSVICFEYLVRPLIAWLGHQPSPARSTVPVHLTRDVPSKLGQEEFLRLCIGRVGDRLVGTPLPRGAGMITSMTKAQGICRIPADSEGQKAEKPVPTELLVPEEVLDQILVCIGSHDNTLDLLTNALMGLEEPITLASTHVGSMGGLMALKKGSTHMAGCHLFDPETQDYNFPFLERYLPDLNLAVINLAVRHQGFIVAPDNSKGISSIQDLKREDVRFINRQRGAGTRILLDDHLAKAGIRAEEVSGYDQEEFTHMAVAVNVQSGAADCGMGIYAAAKALNLGFVPLAKERYDLVIPRSHLDNPKITSVLELLSQEEFKKAIRDLGGYETDLTGQTMQPGMGLGKT